MQKAKKINVDTHPNRVKNPFERLKKSPGKFDQKVYQEQEVTGNNLIKAFTRLYSQEMDYESAKMDRAIVQMRRRQNLLRNQNGRYIYLKQLREAFQQEISKRQSLPKLSYAPQPDLSAADQDNQEIVTGEHTDQIKQKDESSKSVENPENAKQNLPTAAPDMKTSTNQSEHPPARTILQKPPLPSIPSKPEPLQKADTFVKGQGHPLIEVKKATESQPNKETEENIEAQETSELADERSELSSPTNVAMLEKLSYEIVTCTLPARKLNQILPDEPVPVHKRYPIMSNFRRQNVLPTVRHYKQKLGNDTNQLHAKINDYFGCKVLLRGYTIKKSAKPKKQKLLKAIGNDNMKMPELPKY